MTPRIRITDAEFKYVRAVETDIRKTWLAFGWRPMNTGESAHTTTGTTGDSDRRSDSCAQVALPNNVKTLRKA